MTDRDPLDEEPYDPLDERALEPDEGMVRGGTDPDGDLGFLGTLQEARDRAGRIVGRPPRMDVAVTQRRKRLFLRALAQTGNVSLSASAAGWDPGTARKARKADEAFAESWDAAVEVAADLVEAEMFRRAVHGTAEPVWHKPKEGEPHVIGHVTKYSDSLMKVLVEGLKPEKFRQRQDVKLDAGSKGGVLLVPVVGSLEEWEASAAAQQAQYREQEDPE